jgi:uncharacterized SAM-binding protein YcdF (DUF218 family)
MFRLFRWVVRAVVLLALLGVGVVFGGPVLLGAAGRYLITEHPLARADLILPLSEDVPLTVPEAARLYHAGLAPRIVVSMGPGRRGADEDLLRRGIRVAGAFETMLTILEGTRVPREAILTAEERADDLVAESEAMARFLKRHPARSLILVTPKSRSTRAFKAFRTALGPEMRLMVHPVPGDPFDPATWWRDRKDRREVVSEYQALADFWLGNLWRAVTQRVRGAIKAPWL